MSEPAEGVGVEPTRAFARWFSKPLHYRSANPPCAPSAGIEPTLRTPQARGLSISLRGHLWVYCTLVVSIFQRKVFLEEFCPVIN